jgi:hypothetical protein
MSNSGMCTTICRKLIRPQSCCREAERTRFTAKLLIIRDFIPSEAEPAAPARLRPAECRVIIYIITIWIYLVRDKSLDFSIMFKRPPSSLLDKKPIKQKLHLKRVSRLYRLSN